MLKYIRALFRLLYFAAGSIFYISRALVKEFFKPNLDRLLRLRLQWFRLIHKGLGVRIEQFGELPQGSGLLVCNHRSYFDPIVILSEVLAMPVGKLEITKWPIIGLGAKVSGSIFVDRKTSEGRKNARKEILEAIKNGYSVINYPEGTTHMQAQTIDFKPGMFRDAASFGFSIYPIAIEYQKDTDAWVGDDTFLRHFFQCFGKRNTNIRISYGTKIEGHDAEKLLNESKRWIDSELLKLRSGWYN